MTRFRPLSYRTTALSLLASLALGGAAFAEDLRINMAADPAMIDPIAYSELNAGDVVRNMYEAFTKVGPEGQVEPNLALSWEPLTDGPGFRFTLRPGSSSTATANSPPKMSSSALSNCCCRATRSV